MSRSNKYGTPDNPTDVRAAREALRQVSKRCSVQMAAHIERPLSAPDIASFVDSWNKLAEEITKQNN